MTSEIQARSGQNTSHGAFRPDIEGLRGIAVLLVLLYHCTFLAFQGGYVGVDVFFVISGYLITRLLIREFETNTFSVRNFYVRRIRRLIPALLATIILTVLAGILILSPEHLKELGTSSIFAALSLSNVHFALSDGYFETSSKIKPLLHTWSLSVEEQFYLVWPFALWLLFAVGFLRKHLFAVIGIAVALGLVLSEYWISQNPAYAYFLSPFRAYQLLLGALAVGVERHLGALSVKAATALVGLGLLIIMATAVFFDEASPFPGIYGFAPALGGFLVMAAGAHNTLPARALAVSPLMWLGRISYSAYLAHWPIIVYARYLSVDPFTVTEKWILLAASIGAGYLLHHSVEARFRLSGAGKGSGHRWKETLGVALSCATVLAVSSGLWASRGLPVRMQMVPEKQAYAESMKFEFLRDFEIGRRIHGTGTSGTRVLIFGDSMMQNYIPALLQISEIAAAEVTMVTRGGCPMGRGSLQVVNGGVDRGCRSLREIVFAQPGEFDLVIWSQSWMEYSTQLYRETETGFEPATGDGIERWKDIILETVDTFAPKTDRMMIFGPQLTVENVPPILTRIGPLTDLSAIPGALPAMQEIRADERAEFARDLKALVPSVAVVDPKTLLCPRDICRFHDGADSYFFDPIHHTAVATPVLADRISAILRDDLSW